MSEEKLDTLIGMVEGIEKNVTRLQTSVIGDKEAGVEGLAHRVGELEGEVEDVRKDLTTRLSWLKGGAWTVSVLIGVIAFMKDHIAWLN
ncbi:MAG: hypothetical protein V3R57_02065 [Candidatus Bathyarchaeia archaeon]